MNIISVRKMFVFNRAFARLQKEQGHELKPSHVWVLLTVSTIQKKQSLGFGVSPQDVAKGMAKFGRTRSRNKIQTDLLFLVNHGFLDEIDDRVKKFAPTFLGLNTLLDLEKYIRAVRLEFK